MLLRDGDRCRSHDALIRVYDEARNVIEAHEHKGDFKENPTTGVALARLYFNSSFVSANALRAIPNPRTTLKAW